MDAKLVVVGSQITPKEIKLRLPVIIGRGRQATLVLPHPLVSRRHCEIVEHEGFLLVRDLGSLNGTFVDQNRIQQEILPPGDFLPWGRSHSEQSTKPDAPPIRPLRPVRHHRRYGRLLGTARSYRIPKIFPDQPLTILVTAKSRHSSARTSKHSRVRAVSLVLFVSPSGGPPC
jgi:hypothetical protein